MFELRSSVVINSPRPDVYAVLTDFERYLAVWAAGPMGAEKTTSGPPGRGTKFTVTAKVGPFRVRSPYEVFVWEPPARFGGRGIAGPVRFEEEYQLDGEAEVTTLRQTIKVWPRGAFRLVEGMSRRQLQRLIPADLERLKVFIEEKS